MALQSLLKVCSGALTVALGLAACGQQNAQSTGPRIEDRTISLKPPAVTATAALLAVRLQDMKVTQRVEQGTDKVVDAPKLSGTLKVKNTSEDHSLRLIEGGLEYVNAAGEPIRLADTREAPRFQFYSYSDERLDPGEEVSRDVSVSFPSAAFRDKSLREIRVRLEYIPMPYQEQALALPVALGE